VAASAVVVAPLRIARGLQNKVLEALAMGKPTVAGPPALAGFPAEQTPPVVCARTTDEWVAALTRLFADSSEREALADAGRHYVERFYHWDRCLAPLQEIIEQEISAGTTNPAVVPSSGHTRER
jgi:glycosyltransferase involved in cell wall biosynthesis